MEIETKVGFYILLMDIFIQGMCQNMHLNVQSEMTIPIKGVQIGQP